MEARELTVDGRGPIYLQIKRAITSAVLAGQARPGDRIPSEHELMVRFDVSRMTIHKAISQLAAEGLVVRNRKAGTVVAPRRPERAVFEIWDVSAEAAQAGARYRFEPLAQAQRPATAEDALQLGVSEGQPVMWLVGRHRCNGVVVQLEERLVNLKAAPGLANVDASEIPPGRWLLDHVPWTEAEHTIRAVNASGQHAVQLEIAEGDAALVVERRTWRGQRPVTYVRLWCPGVTRTLVGRFAPFGGPPQSSDIEARSGFPKC